MVFVEKMNSMKIYKQPCFLPTTEGNKKKDSAIILLTPSYESSKKLMNNPIFINKRRFESYFLDRDVSYYIGNKQLKEISEDFIYLEETKRSNLKDSDFGIPEDRKYPLDTEQHVRSAIKLFGHAEEGKKKSLAKRISRKASKYGIEIPESTQCYKYLHETVLTDNPQIKNIVFDLGSVLVREVTREDLYSIFPDTPTDYIDTIINMVHDMWASGDYETASFEDQVRFLSSNTNPELRELIPEVYRQIILNTSVYDYTPELLRLLKSRGYNLYFLSNWCKASFEMILKESDIFGFFSLLNGGLVSYQTGTGKPDPRFYEMFVEKYGLRYDECLFFDDRKENIEAAERLGMKAYVFDYTSTYKEIMQDIPVTESFQPAEEDNNLDFIFSSPLTDIMDIKYEMDEKEKRWNSIVIVRGVSPKTLRGRSECIVIRDDMVYLDETESGICSKGGIAKIKYDVPGGGWDPNEPHDICAIRETNEEAMIDVKDVQYVDNYLTIDKVRPDDCYCDGLYSKVYVGKYNGKYTGPIAKVDRADIAVSGTWYKIDDVYDLLNPIHKKAIDQYFGRKYIDPAELESPVDEAVSGSILYHGSHKNIKGGYIMPKNNSHEDGKYVFGATDRNFALCYAGNVWHDGIMNQGYINNKLYLAEVKKDAFKDILDTDGYIYEIEYDNNFYQRGRKVERLSKEKAKIISKTYIKNVFDEIKKSNIDLYYYNDKAPEIIEKKRKYFRENPLDESYIEENKVFSTKNLEYNINKWNSGSSNILFITGLSGSGKSTLAAGTAKKYKAVNIEIDLLEHNDIIFDPNTNNDEGNMIVKSYLEKYYSGAHKFKISNNAKQWANEVERFLKYCISEAKANKDKRYIIEGIQLMDIPDSINMIKNYPIIVVGTSMIKSMWQAYKREECSFIEYMKSFKSIASLKEYIDWYLSMEKDKKNLVKNLKEGAEFVLET